MATWPMVQERLTRFGLYAIETVMTLCVAKIYIQSSVLSKKRQYRLTVVLYI